MSTSRVESGKTDRPFWIVNAVVSVLALAFLTYLLLLRGGTGADPSTLSFLPAVNACFNAASAVLLVLAVLAIKKKQVARHQGLVLSAFASSALFLAGYLAYHYVHGDTKYPGTGGMRVAYLSVLASHVLLSIPVLPLCLAAFYYAFRQDFATHKRITKVLFPVWLYVSVTGVLVFLLLRSAYGG